MQMRQHHATCSHFGILRARLAHEAEAARHLADLLVCLLHDCGGPPRCGSLSLTPSSWKMSWQHKAGDAGSLASGAAVVYPILAKELFGRGTAAGARMNGDTVHLHAPRLVLQCRVAPGELRGCGHCGLDLHDLIPAKRGRRYTHVIAVMKTLMPQLSPVSPPPLQDLSKSMKKHVRSFRHSPTPTPQSRRFTSGTLSSSQDCRSKYGIIFFKMQTITQNSLYQYVADILNREARRIRSFIMRARQLVGSVAAPHPCRY